MVTLKTIALTLGLISSFFISTQGVDKYTDENRPYEFGFNIEGEQHRHEKKDEKGLIMGEFGFITADGVYHVTVYATDEEGRFKILSMKNIRVKPYPTYKQSSGSARQGHSLETSAPQQTLSQGTSPIEKPGIPLKKVMIEKPGRSCSSCSLPTTTSAPVPVIVQPNIQNTPITSNPNFGQNPVQTNPQYPQEPKTNSFPNQQNFPANQQNNYKSPQNPEAKTNAFPNQQNFPAIQQNNFNSPQSPSYSQNGPAGNRNLPQSPPEQGLVAPKEDLPLYPPLDSPLDYPQGPGSNYPAQPNGPSYTDQPGVNPVGRTAKKLDDAPQQRFNSVGAQPNAAFNPNEEPPKKPTLISAQMQIVDKNTDIYRRGPGEKEGLPDGLTTNDMSQLLYTFNYTVGFHGHFEEGYRNGAKQGYYFVTGRNGVRTRVDYVADEKGFRPKITQEVLDLLSEEVPKPETEKEEKYGLKGYEFKWLYFPVDPKRR